jgi:hypothetical protein
MAEHSYLTIGALINVGGYSEEAASIIVVAFNLVCILSSKSASSFFLVSESFRIQNSRPPSDLCPSACSSVPLRPREYVRKRFAFEYEYDFGDN